MSVRIALAVVVVGSLLAASRATGQVVQRHLPIFGEVHSGFIYAGVERSTDADLLIREMVRSAPSGRREDGGPEISRFAFPDFAKEPLCWFSVNNHPVKLESQKYGLRWHIRDGFCWHLDAYQFGFSVYSPVMRMPWEMVDFTINPVCKAASSFWKIPDSAWPKGKAESGFTNELSKDGSLLLPWVSQRSQPLSAAMGRAGCMLIDFIPESGASVLFFVAVPPGGPGDPPLLPPGDTNAIVLLRYSFESLRVPSDPNLPRDDKKVPMWSGQWKTVEAIKSPFLEPFRVTIHGDSYCFVTQSGQLYEVGRKPSDNREMRLLWPPKNGESIVAMLEDVDGAKSYAFTLNSFFEIGPEITPRLCYIGPASDTKPDDPLPVLRRCAATLIDRGMIKLPAAEKAETSPKKS